MCTEKVRLVLSLRELEEFIFPDHAPPADPNEAKAWLKLDCKAMVIIGMTLSDSHLNHVEGISCASKMWRSILDIFERHALLNQLTARREFYTATMLASENVLTFTNRICHLGMMLACMGLQDP